MFNANEKDILPFVYNYQYTCSSENKIRRLLRFDFLTNPVAFLFRESGSVFLHVSILQMGEILNCNCWTWKNNMLLRF